MLCLGIICPSSPDSPQIRLCSAASTAVEKAAIYDIKDVAAEHFASQYWAETAERNVRLSFHIIIYKSRYDLSPERRE